MSGRLSGLLPPRGWNLCAGVAGWASVGRGRLLKREVLPDPLLSVLAGRSPRDGA